MTQKDNTLLSLLDQSQSKDFLKGVLTKALDQIMDMEVSQQIKAGYLERTEEREAYRNGYRERGLATGVGALKLKVPKVRKGTYFPGFLERFQRVENALISVIQEAYIGGVSTRKMSKIIEELGLESISKSQVSDLCQQIKGEVDIFLSSPIEGKWTYVYLDATYIKIREDGRVKSKAAIIAVGVNDKGERHVLGLNVTQSEASIFWTPFLESLQKRGLQGVELVTSDAHAGLKEAIGKVFLGATWQRCWVHFMRNILSHTSKKTASEVLAHLKSIMVFKTQEERRAAWLRAEAELEKKHPKVARMMQEAMEDVLAHTSFPEEHWGKIYTNNPIERLNREIKRRTNCVSIFPNDDAAIRLIGAILLQQEEDWIGSKAFLRPKSLEKNAGEREE